MPIAESRHPDAKTHATYLAWHVTEATQPTDRYALRFPTYTRVQYVNSRDCHFFQNPKELPNDVIERTKPLTMQIMNAALNHLFKGLVGSRTYLDYIILRPCPSQSCEKVA